MCVHKREVTSYQRYQIILPVPLKGEILSLDDVTNFRRPGDQIQQMSFVGYDLSYDFHGFAQWGIHILFHDDFFVTEQLHATLPNFDNKKKTATSCCLLGGRKHMLGKNERSMSTRCVKKDGREREWNRIKTIVKQAELQQHRKKKKDCQQNKSEICTYVQLFESQY